MRPARLLLVAAVAGLASPAARAQPAGEPGPAYLVYAGPYSSSPSSAFGHLFLVLAEHQGDPPPLWHVVTFNAITFDASPFRYLTIGIAGGFLGRFDHFQFHQKTRDYELLDDRDLWLLELRLTPAQRGALQQVLDRTRGRWYPYSFFQHNCAHYLQGALAEATGAVGEPGGVVTPTGVFLAVQESALGGATFHRPSASRRIAALAAKARPAVRERLRREDWREVAADVDWLSSLDRTERRLALEFFGLEALQADSVLPEATRNGLARLRLLNAEPQAGAPEVEATSGPGAPTPPPRFHGYQRVRLLYAAERSAPGRLHLMARGAMHDETDPWLGQQPVSTMELLGLELSAPVDGWRPRLESAVIFSQRSLAASDWTRSRGSWLLEALARRGGLFDAATLHGELRGGLGKTLRLPGETYLHGLVTLAAIGAPSRGVTLALGLELGLVALAASRWRLGGTWTLEHDAFRWPRSVQRARAWTRLDLGAHWGLLLQAASVPASRSIGLGVDWYP